MAKFYLTDAVPAAPKTKKQSRGANIPTGPYEVKGKPPTMPQINAKVQDINIEKNIPSLMQKELPREVSQGLVEGVYQTGKANARAAWAWGQAGAETAQAFNNIAVQLQKSKDYADASRVDNAWNDINDSFDETVSKGGLNAMEANKLWPEYEAKLNSLIEPMNLSSHVRDKAIPDLRHNAARKRIELQDSMRKEQGASDLEAMETASLADIQQGNIESAVNRVHDMYAAGHLTPGQRDQKIASLKVGYDEYRAQRDYLADPRKTLADLEEAVRTGQSETYPRLPISSLQQLRDRAQTEMNRREITALRGIDDGMADGSIKTPLDIDNAAKGNVGAAEIQKRKDAILGADPAFSQEAMAKVELAIERHVPEEPGSGSPKYRQITEQILTTIPRNQQTDMRNKLDAKANPKKEALPGEDWFGSLLGRVEQATKDGRLIPKEKSWWDANMPGWMGGGGPAEPVVVREKLQNDPDYRLKHQPVIDEMWKRERVIMEEMRKWRKGNPDAGPAEGQKRLNELLEQDSSDAGRSAVKPKAPTTSSTVPASAAPDLTLVPDEMAAATAKPTPAPSQAKKLANVNPDLVTRLDALQQKFGTLNITSGYRDPEHNKSVGGAKGSQHIQGNAVDISVKGMSVAERLALIKAASDAGITGIGVYNNALHFDVGPRRAWGPDYHFASVPKWAEGAISRHLGG